MAKNYKKLRQEIKSRINCQVTAEILSFIGYEVDRSFKLKLRDERTASASINVNGGVTDFGNGAYYSDPVAILHECKGISLSEATIYIAHLVGIDVKDAKYQL